MLSWIRTKFGGVVIGVIIGFIAFVFVFYGVLSPKRTRGLGDGAVAGEINGEPITVQDFSKEYNRRLEFFRNMGGGKITEEQLAHMGIKAQVFQELARKKLLVQEADRVGLMPSDEEIRERIQEIPAFQKDGKFDLVTYRGVLQANNYTAGGFERMVREDLMAAQWEGYFRARARVSESEVRAEYATSGNKRVVKYVLLTPEMGQKQLTVAPADIQKFVQDPAKQSLLHARYDQRKASDYKGLTFEVARDSIARDLIASDKVGEGQKALDGMADQVAKMLTADSGSDKRIKDTFKKLSVEAKTTAPLTAQTKFIPGMGDSAQLLGEAFSPNSSIDAAHGGHAKKFVTAAGTVVALVVKSETADAGGFDHEREKLVKQLEMRKERELFEGWLKGRVAKSKIDPNPAVVGNGGGADAEM